jgi:hypothetical protein
MDAEMTVYDQNQVITLRFSPFYRLTLSIIMNWKQLTVFCMLLVMLAQAGLKTAVVAYYYLNQEYIAKNWCEQRNQPKSCCAGSCQVNKWLKVADKGGDEQRVPAPDWTSFKELQLFVEYWEPIVLSKTVLPAKSVFPSCILVYSSRRETDIFHPPCS